jgi:transducin (beta)-like 1
MKTLTSEEVNYMVYRYLLESGFQHTAFLFGHESTVKNTKINPNDVPSGALISFIQKGIQYLQIESKIQNKVTFF